MLQLGLAAVLGLTASATSVRPAPLAARSATPRLRLPPYEDMEAAAKVAREQGMVARCLPDGSVEFFVRLLTKIFGDKKIKPAKAREYAEGLVAADYDEDDSGGQGSRAW